MNRFAVALALAGVLVGARAGVRMFAAPTVTFSTLPALNFNQGQAVTVAFAANGFPTGVTYTAEGLPAGLTMSMGVDTLGHEVGILSGTLAPDTPLNTGSEGVYNARLHASDGAVSNFFSIDVSHWNHGDVFVGAGEWNYQVYREDGTFKTNVRVPDDANSTAGSTTGCAVNWRTGEVWATNFDEIFPAVNVITRHQGGNPLPYTDPSRRLSTERYGVGNTTTPFAGNLNPFDTNPESVAFDNNGNMFVGHSFGYWNDNFDVADANGTPIILHSTTGAGWVYVDAAGQPILDGAGGQIYDNAPISPAGFFESWIHLALPVNILDASNNPIPVPLQGGMDVHRYTPDVDGNYKATDRQFYDFHYGNTGIDTLDLMSDQKTMIYSSEDWYMYRFDMLAAAQLPVVGSNVLGQSIPVSPQPTYGVRVLPPGDGTGGYLAVDQYQINRLDENGRKIQSYDVKGDPDYLLDPAQGWDAGDVNGWFAIAIAPDGRTFWAATRQDVFRFDIASSEQIGTKIHATVGTLHTNQELAGLCVMAEYRAAQEVCGPTGLGNNIDDDHDGTIDEGCFRVEICSALRPGDDDGDGLVDYNDPDCGAVLAQQCVTDGPTDNSVAGICNRSDYEGDNVVVPGVPLPCVGIDCAVWTFTYSAVGLPPGLVMNAGTGDVTGVPMFSIVNPNSESSAPVVFPITVTSTWQRVGDPAATFSNTFNWTIYNRNRMPVAVDDGPQFLLAGNSFTFDVRANDGDIDGDTISLRSFTQPPLGQGTVTQIGQNLQYTAPVSGFGGTTTFTYKLNDSYETPGVSNDATVTVIVNAPPVANPNNYTGSEDSPLTIVTSGILGNDSDPNNDPIHVVVATATQTSNGTVVLDPSGNGAFVYTPNPNFHGVDTFTYQVNDGVLDSNFTTVTITILSVNDVPVAVNDSFTTAEDTPVSGTVTGNDTASGDGGNVWSRISNPSFGNAVVNANGTFTYTPNANFFGSDSFRYNVCDVDGDCSIGTVIITITPVDDVPVAVNDAFTTTENVAVVSTVTGNDTLSPDGGNVWAKLTNPSHGIAVMLPTGAFTYTPNLFYSGTDSFTYNICDIDSDCSTATVTITIEDVDDAPVAVNDAFTTAEDTPVNSTLMTNDTTSSDGGNVWSKVTNPSNGTATVNANGTFNYTPNANFNGTDSFTYKICDVDGDCSTATVTITITSVNDVPVALNDAFTTAEDTPVNSTLVTNDTLSGDGGNVWTKLTNPSNGTATVNASGAFTYTPNANFFGTDSFTYKICDADGDCSTATVAITITSVNDVPVAVNDVFTTAEDAPISGTLTGNDTPSGDGGNVWTKVTSPTNGTATVNPDGTFTYTPNANFFGTDSFTYDICDVNNDCSTATVTITITSVNDVPVALNDAFTTAEDTPVNSTLVTNDTLSGDGGNVWSKVSSPTNGTATVNPDGTFTYTPTANFFGTDSFTYSVCDVNNDCSTATVTITITSVNDVPVALNDAFTTAEDTPVNSTLVTNDTLSGDGGNVWTKLTNPSNGTATVNASGAFTYTPNANFFGTDSFTYYICDVNGDCSTATVTITITSVNDVPVAVNDAFTTLEDTAVTGTLTGNDTPSGDGSNVWSKVTDPTHGTAVVNGDGTFTYTPNANFFGTDSFTYKICDVNNDCSTATVTIMITSVDDAPVAVNDAFTTLEDTPVSGTLTGNDTPSGDGGNVWSKVTSPVNGTAVVNADGTFTYTPNAHFFGTDSFTYKVCDVNNDCSTATVTVTVGTLTGPRMTGGGTFGAKPSSTSSVTHGFELHCDVNEGPNNLEANWGNGERFHLEKLQTAFCTTDPSIKQAPPVAPFNTYTGTGWGYYNGTVKVNAKWVFTDAGEPGSKDTATLTLTNAITGQVVLFATGNISKGNQQAHKN